MPRPSRSDQFQSSPSRSPSQPTRPRPSPTVSRQSSSLQRSPQVPRPSRSRSRQRPAPSRPKPSTAPKEPASCQVHKRPSRSRSRPRKRVADVVAKPKVTNMSPPPLPKPRPSSRYTRVPPNLTSLDLLLEGDGPLASSDCKREASAEVAADSQAPGCANILADSSDDEMNSLFEPADDAVETSSFERALGFAPTHADEVEDRMVDLALGGLFESACEVGLEHEAATVCEHLLRLSNAPQKLCLTDATSTTMTSEEDETSAEAKDGTDDGPLGALQSMFLRTFVKSEKLASIDPSRCAAASQQWAHLIEQCDVSSLRCTHESVAAKFLNGVHRGEAVSSLAQKLLDNTSSVDDIPPLVGVRAEGLVYIVCGNRRLHALRAYVEALQTAKSAGAERSSRPISVLVRVIVHRLPLHHIVDAELRCAMLAKTVLSATTTNGGRYLAARQRQPVHVPPPSRPRVVPPPGSTYT
eukprot:TRINITY_DN32277_c0_g1_i1.p1 TRINITY_DN32277_c0_g1~~TRINITY_DN32277_c0_g1_i1.p1  ORF type:complete len:469 (-),score=56.68 TRINITY_DN32277_c0_g1_i1:116-1522(-)